jgi:2-polyprenyl-3-methyl-5-hydroxy-6-metoxy-1,4-benzoquinol methylase
MTGFDYTYPDYGTAPDPSHRPMYLGKVLKHLSRDRTIQTVIDVGCGGGDFASGLAGAGYNVYGIDLSEDAIAAARARQIGHFAVSSAYDSLTAPFKQTAFDAAVCIETIEHLYSPQKLAQKVREALRPGGLFVVTTPYWGYAKNLALAISGRIDRALTASWEGGHIKHFSRTTLTRVLTEQGFRFVAFEGCGHGIRATPYMWSGMLMAFRNPG